MAKAKSVDEFLKMVFKKTFNAKKEEDPFNKFWFRGENSDYKETSLIPSAYRDFVVMVNTAKKEKILSYSGAERSYSYIEQNIRADFDRKALPFILSKRMENTAWNRYFLMQHYNVNTRLLDWTEDAIKALFFALKDNTDNDAKVWILRPFELNRFTLNELCDLKIRTPVIPLLSDDQYKPQDILDEDGVIRPRELTRRYLKMDFKKEEKYENKRYYPLAIYPPFLDERMAAQKACFTISGDVYNGKLHDIIKLQLSCCSPDNKIIDNIVIDGKSKKKMLNELRLIGIDDSSVFPDLDGLGNALKSKYKSEYKNIKISYEKWYADVFK
jgi:hypothetical protein